MTIAWKRRLNDYGLSDPIIIFLMFITVVSVITEIVSIGMFLPMFELINKHGAEGLLNPDSDIAKYIYDFVHYIGFDFTIEVLLLLSFTLFLLSKILLYLSTYTQSYYSGKIIKDMKNRLLDKYLKANPSYYDVVGIGDFTNSSSSELPAAVNGAMLPIKLLITVLSGIGSIALLMLMSFKLTVISVSVIFVGILIPARWVKMTTKVGIKNSKYNSTVTSFLLDRLQSPRLVRLSNTASIEKNNYSNITEKQRMLSLAIHILKARINLVLEPMVIAISLSMFYVALMFLKMPISSILLYMAVMMRIVPIVRNVLTQKQSINKAVGPIQAIDNLLDNMSDDSNHDKFLLRKGLMKRINTVHALELKDIYFHYKNSSNYALSNVSHTFKKSTLTAIVGPSGGGKTTFVDIISGYRRPSSGAIFINGVDANKYNYEEIMSLVSYVPQDPQIFDGTTIYEHISYGMPNSTKDEIINASKLSGAYDFIKELPKKFDTVLLGKSSGLSGGQKQRLDLSRALLRDTPMLIMDEPTGNLDILSEKKLMLSISKIRETTGKIIIIIAHRIYTIMDADQIIVLEDGEISGVGTHTELLLSNSWYPKAVKELQ
jgi:ABC-type multidrug transport system fused ATPase/permease subunit